MFAVQKQLALTGEKSQTYPGGKLRDGHTARTVNARPKEAAFRKLSREFLEHFLAIFRFFP